MPAFPVPLFASVLLLWLFVSALVRRSHAPVFLCLIALCAAQAGLIAAGLHYGIALARHIMPLSASLIPPLAFIAYVTTAIRSPEPRDALHLLAPAFILFCAAFAPAALDAVIPAEFLAYACALFWGLRQGADATPRLLLGSAEQPGRLWQMVACALVLSALADGSIVLVQQIGSGWLVPWIVSLASSLTLLMVGALVMTPSLQPDPAEPDPPDPHDHAEDSAIMARLAEFMHNDRPYLDPDLTLNRLSRRLRVPAKRLSVAINRETGGNVSRYINRFRIATACLALQQGDSVTAAMLAAGFNTKSNFNREFLRIAGQSPSEFRASGPLRLSPIPPTLMR